MSSWKQKALGLLAIIVAIPAAIVVGLFVYVNATMRPLHPDSNTMPTASQQGLPAGWTGPIEQARQAVRNGVMTQNLPGVSVAVGVDGSIVWAEGFGYADIDTKAPVTPEMRFRVGEASKALTSAAVGQLLEKDRITLDNEIQVYVPAYPEKQWPVTLRQLMAHTAGLRDDAGDEAPIDGRCERAIEGLHNFADDPLRFEPGTKYLPSSYSWVLVSAAVEKVAGEPFFTYMQKQVLEPAGMTRTRPDSAKETIADRATFYFPRFGGDTRYGPEAVREGDHSCFAGASAYLSTPSDLVRFALAFNGGKLVKPSTVTAFQTPQKLASGEETGYGLGWKIETIPLAGAPARMVGHGVKGDFIGGSTYLMTFPDRGIAVAVMSNSSFADVKTIASSIADAFAAQAKAPPAQ